jgi:hypothetical protein
MTMPDHVRSAYTEEMTAALDTADDNEPWAHLERAHIISQPYPWPHTRNHLVMLAVALRQHDRREALGQIVRIIVAAPGSLSGRYPQRQHRPQPRRAGGADADPRRPGHPHRAG